MISISDAPNCESSNSHVPVPVSPLDVGLARRFVFVGFEKDLISRFAQRRRLRRTQVEIDVAVTSGIVVSYSDLIAEQGQVEAYRLAQKS